MMQHSERSEIEALQDAIHACLDFLVTELHWENFRTEMLYFDDEPRKRVSDENARKLQNFLSRPDIKRYVKRP